MSKDAELLEAGDPRLTLHLHHQATADPERPRASSDDERTHFGDSPAERRQFGTTYDPTAPDRDNEAIRVQGQLVAVASQQTPLLEMGVDERVKCGRFFRFRRPQRNAGSRTCRAARYSAWAS
jgi:hypothetical protein